MRIRTFATHAALLFTAALAATGAQAGPNVQWQVTLESPVLRLPGGVALPLPPIPVPRAVVVVPQHGGHADQGARPRDADGDGVPNRHDPVYNPRWDRDGDGVPNRYDAYPNDARHGHGHGHGRGWQGHGGWHRNEASRDERHERRGEWRGEWRDERRDERRGDPRDDRRGEPYRR